MRELISLSYLPVKYEDCKQEGKRRLPSSLKLTDMLPYISFFQSVSVKGGYVHKFLLARRSDFLENYADKTPGCSLINLWAF